MSIYAIRNQPFQLGSNLRPNSLGMGCDCGEAPKPSYISMDDEIWVQATLTICNDEEGVIISGGVDNWTAPGEGDTPGWLAEDGWFINGEGFYRYNGSSENNRLLYEFFTSTLGESYAIELTVSDVTGTVWVEFGEQGFYITADGTYTFTILNAGDGAFYIGNLTGGVTVESVTVRELNTNVTAIFHQDGETDIEINQGDAPGYFIFYDGGFTFQIPMEDTGLASGCFTLELRDNCSDTGIVSQQFSIIEKDCDTLLIRACNDYANMGFGIPFAPRIRIPARMGWPSYNITVEEERYSDGVIMRPTGDRTSSLTIKTGILNEYDHAFLSTLPIWDHVYVGEGDLAREMVVQDGKYEPSYGDDQWLNGAVVFTVAPKAELVHKTLCGPALDGCSPANDPICLDAQMVFSFTNAGDGLANFNATLLSDLNFPPGTASVTVGGGAPVNKTFGTLPDTQTWGPFPEGTSITFRLQNSMNQNCVMTKFFDVPPTVFCGVPDLEYNFIDNGDSTFDLEITMNTTEGFTPGDIYVEQGGVTAGEQAFGALPDTLTFVNLNNSQAVIVHFVNLVEGCTPYVEDIGVPFVCDEPGTINIVTTTDIVIRLESSTGYYTAKKTGGALTVYPISTYLTTSAGEYCVWSSDDAGVISGTGTVFYAGGDGLGVTTANFNNVPGIEAISLDYTEIASIDFSANVTTKQIALEYITVLSSVDLTNNIGLVSFSINNNPDLQEILVSSLPVCVVANAYNCALTQTCVDSLLVAFAASGLAVNVDLTGGTNAAPSPTGLAAKATIEGNGGTVFVNP